MAISYFDVKSYGATGDDTADDTSAIKAAIAAAATSGGTVYFPKGTYRLTGTVAINANNVDLLGEGEYVSRIDADFASGDVLLFGPTTGTTSRNSINKLAVTAKTSRTGGALVHIQNVNTMNISETFIGVNAFDGIFIDGTTVFDVFLERTTVLNCGGVGLRVGSSTLAQNIFVSNSEFGSNNVGINLTNASGVYIQNTSILQSQTNNFVTYPSSGQAVQFVFLQSVISDTLSNGAAYALLENGGSLADINMVNCWGSSCLTGVQTGHVNGLSISACRFINNLQHGLALTYGKNIDVSDCQIFGNSQQSDGTYHGISVGPGISDFKIVNNRSGVGGSTSTLARQQGYGALINSGSGNNFVVMGNAFVSNRTGGFVSGATEANVIVANNITS